MPHDAVDAPSYLLNLPDELLLYINSYLPLRDQIRIGATCKYLREKLHDPILDKLVPRQYSHYDNILRHYEKNPFPVVLDTSVMGGGKSYTSLAVAKRLRLKPCIYCPKSTKIGWMEAGDHYDMDLEMYSYAQLRGKNNKYLTKNPATKEWSATPEWINRVKEGVILIFDECQNLKNATAQFRCALAMAQVVYQHKGSYVLLLSGTPGDKEEQIARYCRLLGIMKSDQLAHQDLATNQYVLDGMLEIINFCLEGELRQQVIAKTSPRTKYGILFKLFVDYIKPQFAIAMKAPLYLYPPDIRNGFFAMSPRGAQKLAEGIRKLQGAIRAFINRQHQIAQGQFNALWRDIGISIATIEMAKIEIFVRQALITLNTTNQKVIIMLFHLKPIAVISEILANYDPLVLTGKHTDRQRYEIFKAFRDDPHRRLLIGNITVLSVGLSLHDMIGDAPRCLYISPNYHIVLLHQACFRVVREATMSQPHITYVYGINQDVESQLLSSLAKKRAVMKGFTDKINHDVKYPDEHPSYIETPYLNNLPARPH